MKSRDITGMKFGRLTVIRFDHHKQYKKGKHEYWLCKCNCGNKKLINKNALLKGSIVSCGCFRKEQVVLAMHKRNIDITGQIFFKLTAVRFDHYEQYKNKKREYWLCKCDCGKETIVEKHNLGKAVKSCGCLVHEAAIKRGIKYSKDITGKRYGRLTVIKFHEKRNGLEYWLCKCDCGNKKIILKYHLGKVINSCGCLLRQTAGDRVRTHGDTYTSLFHRWGRMKERCYNPKHRAYHRYGGRGIKICKEWLKYENFKKWALANGYSDELSIDRIDNDGNYEPSNCRWVTNDIQNRNKSTSVLITYNGETLSCAEWSRKLGKTNNIVTKRLAMGWSEKDAITVPIRRSRKIKDAVI